MEFAFAVREFAALAEAQQVLDAPSAEARLHEPGGRLGQDNFAVASGVIRVRVADEDAFGSALPLLWIEPQAELRQQHPAADVLKIERRHAPKIAGQDGESKSGVRCGN
jgi:hypothetical protein